MDNNELRKLIARAVCKSRSCEGVDCCEWPANAGRRSSCTATVRYSPAADAILTALTTAGLAIVPVEATDEMVSASGRGLKQYIESVPEQERYGRWNKKKHGGSWGGWAVGAHEKARARYAAMIAASPFTKETGR